MIFITLAKLKDKNPENDADASKYVGVLTAFKILLVYICCAFVGMDNKLYKMHGTYTKKYRSNYRQTGVPVVFYLL